jgi:hypothetical protein
MPPNAKRPSTECTDPGIIGKTIEQAIDRSLEITTEIEKRMNQCLSLYKEKYTTTRNPSGDNRGVFRLTGNIECTTPGGQVKIYKQEVVTPPFSSRDVQKKRYPDVATGVLGEPEIREIYFPTDPFDPDADILTVNPADTPLRQSNIEELIRKLAEKLSREGRKCSSIKLSFDVECAVVPTKGNSANSGRPNVRSIDKDTIFFTPQFLR